LGACVALRKESVDRNVKADVSYSIKIVALRKESVDRNEKCDGVVATKEVALRKESVDRNMRNRRNKILIVVCRSPQGERG